MPNLLLIAQNPKTPKPHLDDAIIMKQVRKELIIGGVATLVLATAAYWALSPAAKEVEVEATKVTPVEKKEVPVQP